MNEEAEMEMVDVTVTPEPESTPRRGRMIAGGLVVVAALTAGGIVVASQGNDSSEVAAAESNNGEPSGAQDAASADDVQESVEDAIELPASDALEFATDSAVGFGFGPSEVVFADGEFVSLASSVDGIVVSRSTDGTNWSSQPTVGLPDNANAFNLAQSNSGWVTVVEIWPEFDVDQPEFFFGPGPQPERFLGFSEDLVTWTTRELPEPDLDGDDFSVVQGVAAVGDQVGLLLQIQTGGQDEVQILFEQGHITEADLENFCGGGLVGDDYVAYTCDFGDFDEEAMEDFGGAPPTTAGPVEGEDGLIFESDAVTTTTAAAAADDEDVAIPTTTLPPASFDGQQEQVELVRLSPGEPGYDEIIAIVNGSSDFEMPPAIVMAGPIDGDFTATELPTAGYSSGIVSTDTSFVVRVNDYESNSAVVLSSPDGVTWSEAGDLGNELRFENIVASGDRLLATGQDLASPGDVSGLSVWVSNDLGATWTPGDLDTALFDSYGTPISGPAGFAVQLEGATEPYEDDFVDPFIDIESVDVVVDGFTMTIELESGNASLFGPDGTVIHESVNEEAIVDGGAENILRTEGPFLETLIWLNPENGEDLVTFTSSDIDAVFEEIFSEQDFDVNEDDFDVNEDFVEPPRAKELWFSADGISWTLLQSEELSFTQDGYSGLAGVGDDEVLIRTETSVEPPAELLGFEAELRDPTDEEIAALDAWFAQSQQDNIEWTAIPVS